MKNFERTLKGMHYQQLTEKDIEGGQKVGSQL